MPDANAQPAQNDPSAFAIYANTPKPQTDSEPFALYANTPKVTKQPSPSPQQPVAASVAATAAATPPPQPQQNNIPDKQQPASQDGEGMNASKIFHFYLVNFGIWIVQTLLYFDVES